MTCKTNKLTAIDLCCGAGGWAIASRGLPIEFAAVVDWAPDCLETWRLNHQAAHPEARRLKLDLSHPAAVRRVIEATAGRPVELILGGIPCEQITPLRSGRVRPTAADMDELHRLIDNVLTIVRELSPRYWCIEDVVQIERHLPLPLVFGREIPRRRIDAAEFGPQRRRRTYLREFPPPVADPTDAAMTLGDCLDRGPFLTEPRIDEMASLQKLGSHGHHLRGDCYRPLDPDAKAPTIISQIWRGSRSRRCFVVPSPAGPRVLTWQEAARVQGFPDDFRFGCTATRAAKMIGQAIPIHVGRAILRAICAGNRPKTGADLCRHGT